VRKLRPFNGPNAEILWSALISPQSRGTALENRARIERGTISIVGITARDAKRSLVPENSSPLRAITLARAASFRSALVFSHRG